MKKKQIYPAIENLDKIYVSLQFLNSNIFQKVSKISKSHVDSINISHKTSYSLSNHVVNSKDKIEKHRKNRIYKLQCSDCPASHIGRSLKVRVNEHIKKIMKSPFGHHLKFNIILAPTKILDLYKTSLYYQNNRYSRVVHLQLKIFFLTN